MDSLGHLDTMDPNVPSRQPTGKLQATQQLTSRVLPPVDRKSAEASISDTATSTAGDCSHVTRPSLAGMHSFQRPRKRVVWRNKACFIALPLEDEFGRKTSRESYLGQDECERRLRDWQSRGFDTNGFTLAPEAFDSHSTCLDGQSRAMHPDPEDEKIERADGAFRVKIPDRRLWEAYVNHLKEDKLRALGVDEPVSRNSPALSVMSRQGSSPNSVKLTSPTLASSSHVAPFAPSFHGAAKSASYMGEAGISQIPPYSMAQSFNEPSLVSPSHSPQSSEPHILGTWSPQRHLVTQQGSRLASPQPNGYMQPFRHVAPSLSSAGISNVFQVSNQGSIDLLARTREQQHSLPSYNSPRNEEQLVPPVAYHDQIGIATQIPREPRSNSDETSQGGVDGARRYVPYSMSSSSEGRYGAKAAQFDETYGDYQCQTTSKVDEIAASQDARTNQSTVDAGPNLGGVTDHDLSHAGQLQSRCSSKVSQLNVNAPRFEPGTLESSRVFSFFGNRQAHKLVENESLGLPSSGMAVKDPNGLSQPSKWNVAAPAFTPKASVTATIPSRVFSFSASRPSLRPDAPAFRPSGSIIGAGKPTREQNIDLPTNKIFGDVDFSNIIEHPKPKPVPSTKPDKESESKSPADENMDGQEDESGRITQADGRQKRMRRERDDGDRVPLFAPSEEKPPRMNRGSEDQAAYFVRTPSPEGGALDATTLDAATDLLEGLIEEMSATEASDLMQGDESVDEGLGKPQQYISPSVREAASFNAAHPPDSHEITRATQDFLGNSSQFALAFDRALGHRASSSGSSCSSTKKERKEFERKCQGEPEDSVDRTDQASQSSHLNIMNGVRYVEPSYNELDSIMKHLNREDSDFGVERQPSPWTGRRSCTSPIEQPGSPFHELATSHQLLLSANTKSDAPSSSPNRLQEKYQYLPPTDSESADPSLVEMVARAARYSPSYRPSKTSPPTHPLNKPDGTPPNEWDDAISSLDDDRFHSKATFEGRVNEVMEGIVQRELQPLEQAICSIQQTLAQFSDQSASRRSRSSGALEVEHSDADDEDDVDEMSQSRLKSPLRDRKLEQLKASISEVAAAQQNSASASQLIEMMVAVKDLKATVQERLSPPQLSGDIKNVVEEAVGRQMRGRSAPVTSSSQAAAAEKSQLQIAGLESMLKIADARANDEMQARRSVEDELADTARSLRVALQEASEQRESAEATERSLQEFHTERQQAVHHTAMLEGSQESLQKTVSGLFEKNSVLEETLAEYRLSSNQWRSEISDVKHENKDLRRNISSLNAEMEEIIQGRQALRAKVDNLQGEVTTASRNVASDHMRWLSKEEEHRAKLEILSARLEAEARTRERLKLEVDRTEAQEKETMKTRYTAEQLHNTNAHLESVLAELRSECHDHQGTIAGLRQQIELVKADADSFRSRHELMPEEASESRSVALGEAARFHERIVKELEDQHRRSLDNALEDKQRSETYYGNQLSLADEKVVHYQDRIGHLEERLEIARSAAHAAVQAAQSKKICTPRTSLSMTEASDRGPLPEKISPQALRESIIVLQEQLQERETRIEQLEYRLSTVDLRASDKLKDAEIEISWLRELLGIRIEDLDDLIATISQPSYDPGSVKAAATRLKANLQMEQQERERALASFPSLARVSNIAASPKALPLAAAAAWGNWRKGRDSAFANLTPSKPSTQSFLAGLMTPPGTDTRTAPESRNTGIFPLSSNRSVRAPTKPKQSLAFQEERDKPLRRQPQQNPVTPPLMRKGSYDLDAREGTTFGDEDRNKVRDEEPFGPNLGGIVGRM